MALDAFKVDDVSKLARDLRSKGPSTALLESISVVVESIGRACVRSTVDAQLSQLYLCLKLYVACAAAIDRQKIALSACLRAVEIAPKCPTIQPAEHAALLRRCVGLAVSCNQEYLAEAMILRHTTAVSRITASDGAASERAAMLPVYRRLQIIQASRRSEQTGHAANLMLLQWSSRWTNEAESRRIYFSEGNNNFDIMAMPTMVLRVLEEGEAGPRGGCASTQLLAVATSYSATSTAAGSTAEDPDRGRTQQATGPASTALVDSTVVDLCTEDSGGHVDLLESPLGRSAASGPVYPSDAAVSLLGTGSAPMDGTVAGPLPGQVIGEGGKQRSPRIVVEVYPDPGSIAEGIADGLHAAVQLLQNAARETEMYEIGQADAEVAAGKSITPPVTLHESSDAAISRALGRLPVVIEVPAGLEGRLRAGGGGIAGHARASPQSSKAASEPRSTASMDADAAEQTMERSASAAAANCEPESGAGSSAGTQPGFDPPFVSIQEVRLQPLPARVALIDSFLAKDLQKYLRLICSPCGGYKETSEVRDTRSDPLEAPSAGQQLAMLDEGSVAAVASVGTGRPASVAAISEVEAADDTAAAIACVQALKAVCRRDGPNATLASLLDALGCGKVARIYPPEASGRLLLNCWSAGVGVFGRYDGATRGLGGPIAQPATSFVVAADEVGTKLVRASHLVAVAATECGQIGALGSGWLPVEARRAMLATSKLSGAAVSSHHLLQQVLSSTSLRALAKELKSAIVASSDAAPKLSRKLAYPALSRKDFIGERGPAGDSGRFRDIQTVVVSPTADFAGAFEVFYDTCVGQILREIAPTDGLDVAADALLLGAYVWLLRAAAWNLVAGGATVSRSQIDGATLAGDVQTNGADSCAGGYGSSPVTLPAVPVWCALMCTSCLSAYRAVYYTVASLPGGSSTGHKGSSDRAQASSSGYALLNKRATSGHERPVSELESRFLSICESLGLSETYKRWINDAWRLEIDESSAGEAAPRLTVKATRPVPVLAACHSGQGVGTHKKSDSGSAESWIGPVASYWKEFGASRRLWMTACEATAAAQDPNCPDQAQRARRFAARAGRRMLRALRSGSLAVARSVASPGVGESLKRDSHRLAWALLCLTDACLALRSSGGGGKSVSSDSSDDGSPRPARSKKRRLDVGSPAIDLTEDRTELDEADGIPSLSSVPTPVRPSGKPCCVSLLIGLPPLASMGPEIEPWLRPQNPDLLPPSVYELTDAHSDEYRMRQRTVEGAWPLLNAPTLLQHLPFAVKQYQNLEHRNSQRTAAAAAGGTPTAIAEQLIHASALVDKAQNRGFILVPVPELTSSRTDGSCKIPVDSLRRRQTGEAGHASFASASVGLSTPSGGGSKRPRVRFEEKDGTPVGREVLVRNPVRCESVDVDGDYDADNGRLMRWQWKQLPQSIRRLTALSPSALVASADESLPSRSHSNGIPSGVEFAVSTSDALSVVLQALLLRCEWKAAARLAAYSYRAILDACRALDTDSSDGIATQLLRSCIHIDCSKADLLRMLHAAGGTLRRNCVAVALACIGQLSTYEAIDTGATSTLFHAAMGCVAEALCPVSGTHAQDVRQNRSVSSFAVTPSIGSAAICWSGPAGPDRAAASWHALMRALSISRCLSSCGCFGLAWGIASPIYFAVRRSSGQVSGALPAEAGSEWTKGRLSDRFEYCRHAATMALRELCRSLSGEVRTGCELGDPMAAGRCRPWPAQWSDAPIDLEENLWVPGAAHGEAAFARESLDPVEIPGPELQRLQDDLIQAVASMACREPPSSTDMSKQSPTKSPGGAAKSSPSSDTKAKPRRSRRQSSSRGGSPLGLAAKPPSSKFYPVGKGGVVLLPEHSFLVAPGATKNRPKSTPAYPASEVGARVRPMRLDLPLFLGPKCSPEDVQCIAVRSMARFAYRVANAQSQSLQAARSSAVEYVEDKACLRTALLGSFLGPRATIRRSPDVYSGSYVYTGAPSGSSAPSSSSSNGLFGSKSGGAGGDLAKGQAGAAGSSMEAGDIFVDSDSDDDLSSTGMATADLKTGLQVVEQDTYGVRRRRPADWQAHQYKIGQISSTRPHAGTQLITKGCSLTDLQALSLQALVVVRLACQGNATRYQDTAASSAVSVANAWCLPALWQLCRQVPAPTGHLWPADAIPSLLLAWCSSPRNYAYIMSMPSPPQLSAESAAIAPREQEQVIASVLYACNGRNVPAGSAEHVKAGSLARVLSTVVSVCADLGDFYLSGLFQWRTMSAEHSAWQARDDDPRTAYDWAACESPNAPWMTAAPLKFLQAVTGELPTAGTLLLADPDGMTVEEADGEAARAYASTVDEYFGDDGRAGRGEDDPGTGNEDEASDGFDCLLDLLQVYDKLKGNGKDKTPDASVPRASFLSRIGRREAARFAFILSQIARANHLLDGQLYDASHADIITGPTRRCQMVAFDEKYDIVGWSGIVAAACQPWAIAQTIDAAVSKKRSYRRQLPAGGSAAGVDGEAMYLGPASGAGSSPMSSIARPSSRGAVSPPRAAGLTQHEAAFARGQMTRLSLAPGTLDFPQIASSRATNLLRNTSQLMSLLALLRPPGSCRTALLGMLAADSVTQYASLWWTGHDWYNEASGSLEEAQQRAGLCMLAAPSSAFPMLRDAGMAARASRTLPDTPMGHLLRSLGAVSHLGVKPGWVGGVHMEHGHSKALIVAAVPSGDRIARSRAWLRPSDWDGSGCSGYLLLAPSMILRASVHLLDCDIGASVLSVGVDSREIIDAARMLLRGSLGTMKRKRPDPSLELGAPEVNACRDAGHLFQSPYDDMTCSVPFTTLMKCLSILASSLQPVSDSRRLAADSSVYSMLELPAEDRSLQVVGRVKHVDVSRQARGLLADLYRLRSCIMRDPLQVSLWIRCLAVTDALSADMASRNPCRRLVGMATEELQTVGYVEPSQMRSAGGCLVASLSMPSSWFGLVQTARFTALHSHSQAVVIAILSAAGLDFRGGSMYPADDAPHTGEQMAVGEADGRDLANCLSGRHGPPGTYGELLTRIAYIECQRALVYDAIGRRRIVCYLLLQKAAVHLQAARGLKTSQSAALRLTIRVIERFSPAAADALRLRTDESDYASVSSQDRQVHLSRCMVASLSAIRVIVAPLHEPEAEAGVIEPEAAVPTGDAAVSPPVSSSMPPVRQSLDGSIWLPLLHLADTLRNCGRAQEAASEPMASSSSTDKSPAQPPEPLLHSLMYAARSVRSKSDVLLQRLSNASAEGWPMDWISDAAGIAAKACSKLLRISIKYSAAHQDGKLSLCEKDLLVAAVRAVALPLHEVSVRTAAVHELATAKKPRKLKLVTGLLRSKIGKGKEEIASILSEAPVGWLAPGQAGRGQSEARRWDMAWHSMAMESGKLALAAGEAVQRANATGLPKVLRAVSSLLMYSAPICNWNHCVGKPKKAFEAYSRRYSELCAAAGMGAQPLYNTYAPSVVLASIKLPTDIDRGTSTAILAAGGGGGMPLGGASSSSSSSSSEAADGPSLLLLRSKESEVPAAVVMPLTQDLPISDAMAFSLWAGSYARQCLKSLATLFADDDRSYQLRTVSSARLLLYLRRLASATHEGVSEAIRRLGYSAVGASNFARLATAATRKEAEYTYHFPSDAYITAIDPIADLYETYDTLMQLSSCSVNNYPLYFYIHQSPVDGERLDVEACDTKWQIDCSRTFDAMAALAWELCAEKGSSKARGSSLPYAKLVIYAMQGACDRIAVTDRRIGYPAVSAHATVCLLLGRIGITAFENDQVQRCNGIVSTWADLLGSVSPTRGYLRWRVRMASKLALAFVELLGAPMNRTIEPNSDSIGAIRQVALYLAGSRSDEAQPTAIGHASFVESVASPMTLPVALALSLDDLLVRTALSRGPDPKVLGNVGNGLLAVRQCYEAAAKAGSGDGDVEARTDYQGYSTGTYVAMTYGYGGWYRYPQGYR